MENVRRDVQEQKQPSIIIESEARFMAMRLAKAGYYGGNPEQILKAPVDVVLDMLDYEKFESDLNQAYKDLREQEQ